MPLAEDELRAAVREQLVAGESLAIIERYVRANGLEEDEAKALVKNVRRRRRRDLVDQMVSALEEGLEDEEIVERFVGCGESEAWVRKALRRADSQLEEVVERDPVAFRRRNLIALGVVGIAGGLVATLISETPDGTARFYWGAVVAGALALTAGLATRRGGE